jgi:acyl-CoA thioesterase
VTTDAPIREFLALEAGDDPLHWRVEIQPRVLTFAGAVHGGSLLAMAVEALEGAFDRPLVWAAAQYLNHAGPTGTIDIEITPEIVGRNTTQARATLRIGEVDVISVLGALGSRPFPHEGVWASMPDIPPPGASEPWLGPQVDTEQLTDHYEIRFAIGRTLDALDGVAGPGRAALWCHVLQGARALSAGDLALVGDLLMPSLSDAFGVPITANSLDNTLRVVERAATDWVLLDVAVDAAAGGFVHAGAHLWTEDGTLLAIVSQTLALRAANPEGRSTRRGRRIVSS